MTALKEGVKHPVATVHQLFEHVENGHDLRNWNAIRRWAARNAYTLVFLSFMFFVTWIIDIIAGVFL
jgi:hypothetical protein